MYCGSYHLALRRAADALTNHDRVVRVLILSTLHGFVALDDLIAPYDLRMDDEGSATSERLRQQAAGVGTLNADVTVLAPART